MIQDPGFAHFERAMRSAYQSNAPQPCQPVVGALNSYLHMGPIFCYPIQPITLEVTVAMVRAFKTAINFLTVVQLRQEPPADLVEVGKSVWAFPFVGAAMGLILAGMAFLLSGVLPMPLVAVLVVTIWTALTGGLHLDGWTDCWDALAAAVPPERRMEIMKDSRLGTFGALGLMLLMAAKGAAIVVSPAPAAMLLIAPIVGRSVLVLTAAAARRSLRATPPVGMLGHFVEGLDDRGVAWAGILGFFAACFLGWRGVLAAVIAYVAAMAFRRFAENRLPRINGDVIGAACELAETTTLVVGCVMWS